MSAGLKVSRQAGTRTQQGRQKLTKTTGQRWLSFVMALMMVMTMMVGAGVQTAFAVPALTIGPGYHIIAGGTYSIDSTATGGVIYVDTPAQITLVGNGTASGSAANTALTIECTVPSANLTLQNLWISSPYSGGSVIDFMGTDNSLSVADGSTAILESNGYNNSAVVHVPGKDGKLTISGTATSNLYIYKSSVSAAVGGNVSEASGEIVFDSGNFFAKGSQTGAVIGGDSTVDTNGDITFNGTVFANIEANARGAAIGASNQGECAGDVYIYGNANVNITCDFTGPAIGHGSSGKTAGTLSVVGGSLDITLTQNAVASGFTSAQAINAAILTGSIPLIYRYDTPNTSLSITASGGYTYSGTVNTWGYTASQGYTPNNWTANKNSSVYLYVPSAPASITVSGISNPLPVHAAGISYDAANIVVTIDQYNPISQFYAVEGNSFIVTAKPANSSGSYTVTDVTTSSGTSTNLGNGQWQISGFVKDFDITVNSTQGNPVTFSAGSGTVYVNDEATTSAYVAPNGSLDFTIVPPAGQKVATVSATVGTVVQSAGNSWNISNVSAASTVSVTYAADTTAWLAVPNYDVSWYSSGGTSFAISSAAQLAGLSYLVYSGTDFFAGDTITLTADVDLLGREWTPISGGATGVKPFAGTFDGGGHLISGLSITNLVPGTSQYGLFGANGGTLQNFKVSGTSAGAWAPISTTSSITQVGGAVGYSTGSVYNVSNSTGISVTGASTTEVGGVIGVLDAIEASYSITAQTLANTADLSSRSRFGGVIGAVYAAPGATAVVDQAYNTGTITGTNNSGRSYVGGIVGYDQGTIKNSYNQGNVVAGAGIHTYAGGIAGLLNGASSIGTTAVVNDSYSVGAVTGDAGRAQALWGFADNTNTVTVSNTFWLSPMTQSLVGVVTSNVSAQSQATFQSSTIISAGYLDAIYFAQSGTDYPVLNWQNGVVVTGSQRDFNSALANLTSTNNTVTIASTPIAINSGVTTVDIANVNGIVTRASGYTGNLLNVESGGTLTVASGTIGSNSSLVGVYVNGGVFNVAPAVPPAAVTFQIVEIISLASGSYTNVLASVTNITGSLNTRSANTDSGTLVFDCATEDIATDGLLDDKFTYADPPIKLAQNENQINIA